MKKYFAIIIISLIVLAAFPLPVSAQQDGELPVVKAVLYYSPTCPHCEKVITVDLPPLIDQYGDQLMIIGIDVSTQGGAFLYQAAIDWFNIPDEEWGVPMLIIGDVILVGDVDIPEQFPGLIEAGLDAGGVDWPQIPELLEAIAFSQEEATANAGGPASAETPASQPTSTQVAAQPTEAQQLGVESSPDSDTITEDLEEALETKSMTITERFLLDPIANSLAVIVLLGLILSVLIVGVIFILAKKSGIAPWPDWIIPVLVLVGLAVAMYLSYVEVSSADPFCGPVGNCEQVQQSEYAKLFGVLPVGMLGFFGYLMIGGAWMVRRFMPNLKSLAGPAAFIFATIGTLFSIYLTFLEPFVIGASCMWCLTSAVVIALLMWVTLPLALQLPQDQPEQPPLNMDQTVEAVSRDMDKTVESVGQDMDKTIESASQGEMDTEGEEDID
ncbi:vitamin K epoxide reductase family protein [Chloroflexota bacterium]